MKHVQHAVWSTVSDVPMPVWVIAAVEIVLLAVAVGLLIRARRKAKAAATAEPATAEQSGDEAQSADGATPLLVLALALCSVVLGAFIVGTYEGSTAFAIDKLGWDNWRKVIPWAALDAGGFGFGLLWIRAVILKRSPVRPRRVVYLCSGFSATLQMIQGGTKHAWPAGLFLAYIAVLMGLVLHTLVDQLRDRGLIDDDWHKNPPFGLRWITYFPNTFAAFLAWVNHPVEGADPTVTNALANLDRVRAGKRGALAARLMERQRFSRWTMMAPWVRPRQISAVITSVEAKAAAQVDSIKAETTAMIDALRAEQAEAINKLLAEQAAVTERADLLGAELDTLRADLPAQIAAAEQAAREQAAQDLRAQVEQEMRAQAAQNQRADTAQADARRTPRPRAEQRAQTANRPNLHVITPERSDEEIADQLYEKYAVRMAAGRGALSRYRVEQDAPTNSRQAERVLDLLARRYAAQAQHGAHRSTAQSPAQADCADDEESHRASHELAEAR